jgi:hypothetical protein
MINTVSMDIAHHLLPPIRTLPALAAPDSISEFIASAV